MKKREGIYDLYWKFAFERQEIFFKRMNGKSKPWTEDIILQEYKFTNCYRFLDRVSQFLIKEIINDENNFSEEDKLFRILFFKIFNRIETWESIQEVIGDISLSNFDFNIYDKALSNLKENSPIYSSAYISCANNAFGFKKKHQNHLALLEKMFIQDNIFVKIKSSKSFREVFEILVGYPLIGNFMAYQLVTDINYSYIIDFDENDFVIHGPGSKRGIDKCFESKGKFSYEEIIEYMVVNQENEFKRLNLDFKYIDGRKLKNIDCQNIFCEVDKYLRNYDPSLKSNRSRIKTKFIESSNKLEFVLPNKLMN